jgi:hypothetical protein
MSFKKLAPLPPKKSKQLPPPPQPKAKPKAKPLPKPVQDGRGC